MFCPKCGKSVQDNARFCGSCGQTIEAASGGDAPRTPPPGAGAAAAVGGTNQTRPEQSLAGLVERIKNLLLTPKSEWPVIAAEPTSVTQLYKGYVMPLAALAALMSFLRMSVIGVSLPFGDTLRTPFLSGLLYALLSFGFGLLGLFLVGLIINGLAPTFGGTRDQRQALKTAAYAFTPAYLSAVLALLPVFASLLELAAGLYGIYLLYLGLPQLMRSPREKATGYTAVVVICPLLMGVVLGALSAATGGFGRGGFAGMAHTTLTPEQRQQRAAAVVGGMLGGALGTDEKGKAGLTAAIGNLAAAGQNMNQATQTAAATPAAGTADPQQAAAATAGLLTALGGAMAGSKHVDPVDFHRLKDLLPASSPDLQRTDAQGNSQQALGVKGSSATANYQTPTGGRAQVKIADLSGVAGLLDLANSVTQGQSSESDTGYEKNTTLAGRAAHEKYDNGSRHGEISFILVKRFGVDVSGDGIDMAQLEQFASTVDFARLESMQDAGAQAQ